MLLALAVFSLIVPTHAQAYGADSYLSKLETFIKSVRGKEAGTLRGVYIPNVLAYPIVQQPEGDSGFVSEQSATVTQFAMAKRTGNIGLLAHNTLAGKSFFNIIQGSQITLIYDNGRTETFVVDQILMYQVLPYGQYRNLQTQEIVYVGELFNKAYSGEYHLTLQTCIESEGNYQWGRLFIIAKPVSNLSESLSNR
jgi:hypothetical protein